MYTQTAGSKLAICIIGLSIIGFDFSTTTTPDESTATTQNTTDYPNTTTTTAAAATTTTTELPTTTSSTLSPTSQPTQATTLKTTLSSTSRNQSPNPPVGTATIQTQNPNTPTITRSTPITIATTSASTDSIEVTENLATTEDSTIVTTTTTTPLFTTSTTKYPTYLPINGTSCPGGFKMKLKTNLCVYLCEDKLCQNGGDCSVVTNMEGTEFFAVCSCTEDDDYEYYGDNCESSRVSRLKERKITLGILIPVACLSILLLMCACAKLRRSGDSAKSMQAQYELNSGAL